MHYRLPKSVERLDVTTWDPKTDCVIAPTDFCSNCKLVGTKGPGAQDYLCLGHDPLGGVGPKSAQSPAGITQYGGSSSSTATPTVTSAPMLDAILWDYHTRKILREKPHCSLAFGATESKDGNLSILANTTNKVAMRVAIEASLRQYYGPYQHSGFVAFRNETSNALPESAYGARAFMYQKSAEKKQIRYPV